MKSARKKPTAGKLSHKKAAEAAALAEFDLCDEQRRRLVVNERD